MLRSRTSLVLCCLALALVACVSKPQTGLMVADWTPPAGSGIAQQRVTIAWESGTLTTGNMTFTLGRGGQRYVGSYLLIENTTNHLEVQPTFDLWDADSFSMGSAPAANSWFAPGWGVSDFVQHYDGRVVVGLHGNHDGNARCHFTLTDTNVGIPGGGSGECQVDDGGHLAVRF